MGFLDVGPGWVALMGALYYVNPMGCFWPFCAAMLCHELGHAITLWAFGVPVHRLRLNLGGAVLDTGEMDYRQELVCAMAGPAANFLLLPLGHWFPMFGVMSLCLGIFNLLPILPLDGGRALRAGLSLFWNVTVVARVLAIVSLACGVLLAALAIYVSVVLHGGFWPVLVAALTLLRIGLSVAEESKSPL